MHQQGVADVQEAAQSSIRPFYRQWIPAPRKIVVIGAFRSWQGVEQGSGVYRGTVVLMREGSTALSDAQLINAFRDSEYDREWQGDCIIAVNDAIRYAIWDELADLVEGWFALKGDITLLEHKLHRFSRKYQRIITKILHCGGQSYHFDTYFQREKERKQSLYFSYLLYSLKSLAWKCIVATRSKEDLWPALVAMRKWKQLQQQPNVHYTTLYEMLVMNPAITMQQLKQKSDQVQYQDDSSDEDQGEEKPDESQLNAVSSLQDQPKCPLAPLTHRLDYGELLNALCGWRYYEEDLDMFIDND